MQHEQSNDWTSACPAERDDFLRWGWDQRHQLLVIPALPTDRQTDRQTRIQTDIHRYRQTHTDTDRQTQIQTDRHRYRQTDTDTDRHTQIQTDRHRYRQTDTDTDRHTQIQTDIHIVHIHCVSKKVPTFQLSVTLSNLNRFFKFLHCWKAYEICYKTHATLPTSPYACCYTTLEN